MAVYKQTTRQEGKQRQTTLQKELGRLSQMNNEELAQEVQRQLDANSALEVKSESEHEDEVVPETRNGEADAGAERDPEDGDDGPRYDGNNRSADDPIYDRQLVAEQTLAEYLQEQLADRRLTATEQLIAEHIIGNIDDNGRLQRQPRDIADDITFGEGIEIETEQVRAVLQMVQQLDPPGVAATSVQECLLLQLRRKRPVTPDVQLAIDIVSDHFDELAAHRYDTIATALETDDRHVRQVHETVIKRLNPNAAAGFSSGVTDTTQHITPDFVVTREDDDTLTVTLVNRIPELQISQSYSDTLEHYTRHAPATMAERNEVRNIRDSYDRAEIFLRVLRMRRENLFAVMDAIVRRQHAYFMSGDPADMVPLRMQDIAEAVNRDVSSISRAVNNKYVLMPTGNLRPLKHFFVAGMGPRGKAADPEAPTQRAVLHALQQIVDTEDKRSPLSDSTIARLLKEQGYPIARRTVVKYRERLNILNTELRRDTTATATTINPETKQ